MGHDQTTSALSNVPGAGNPGSAEPAPLATAWAWLDALAPRAMREMLRLEAAHGRVLAEKVLGDKALAADPAFATNVERVKRRAETDARVAAVFGAMDEAALTQKLEAADIAFARVNSTGDLAVHPQLCRIEIATPSGVVSYPSPPARSDAAPRRYGAVPSLGEHTAQIRAELLPGAKRARE